MRLCLRIFGRELWSFEAEQDHGIRELAAAIGELAQPAVIEEDDDEDEEPERIQRTTDAWVERDDDPHDPTMGWRDDYDDILRPGKGMPDAKRRGRPHTKGGFGFGKV